MLLLACLTTLLGFMILLRSTYQLFKIRSNFGLAEYIIEPIILLNTSYFTHSLALFLINLYRLIAYQFNPDTIVSSFLVPDFPTKLYWVFASARTVFFVLANFQFQKNFNQELLHKPRNMLSLLLLAFVAIYLSVISTVGLFTLVNYDISRLIIAILYLLGSITLLINLRYQIQGSKSATVKSRLFIFQLQMLSFLTWIIIGFVMAVSRIGSEPGNFLYYLPSLVIAISFGFVCIFIAYLSDNMVTIPNWIRRRFRISHERFSRYHKLQDQE